jgi:hypothetical protein
MPNVIPKWNPKDTQKQYERQVKNLNLKAESFVDFYLPQYTLNQVVNNLPVTACPLYVISASAIAETPGSNDGTVGIGIQLSGGATPITFYVLPKNAASTTLPNSSGVFGAGYPVGAPGTLTITEVSDDHVSSSPAKIRLTLGLRLV